MNQIIRLSDFFGRRNLNNYLSEFFFFKGIELRGSIEVHIC